MSGVVFAPTVSPNTSCDHFGLPVSASTTRILSSRSATARAFAGGENVFGNVGQHSPWLSWEELQVADPDVLVLCPCGFTLERTLVDVSLLQHHPVWHSLQAVQNGRVYAIDGNAYLNRSGPRLVESAELLGRVLWGERLGIEVDPAGWKHIA